MQDNYFELNNIKRMVLESSPDDFSYNSNTGIYTYIKDVRVTIREDRTYSEFKEDWVKKVPNINASRAIHNIYFNENPILEFFLVSIDGGRVNIPIPKIDKMTITKEQYIFGKLTHEASSNSYRFDDYLKRVGISVEL